MNQPDQPQLLTTRSSHLPNPCSKQEPDRECSSGITGPGDRADPETLELINRESAGRI